MSGLVQPKIYLLWQVRQVANQETCWDISCNKLRVVEMVIGLKLLTAAILQSHVGKMAEHCALRLFTCHVTGVAEFFRFHHGGPVLFK